METFHSHMEISTSNNEKNPSNRMEKNPSIVMEISISKIIISIVLKAENFHI